MAPTGVASLTDSGYLMDKDTLPVLGIDTGGDVSGYVFRLGPLECYGSIDEVQGTAQPMSCFHFKV